MPQAGEAPGGYPNKMRLRRLIALVLIQAALTANKVAQRWREITTADEITRVVAREPAVIGTLTVSFHSGVRASSCTWKK